jgi:serine phosphatase RsbU (regulator of sigma subunit)
MLLTDSNLTIDVRPGTSEAACGDFAASIALDHRRTAIAVGDIAGRGEATGIAATALHAYVRSLLLSTESPAAILQASDEFFKRVLLKEETPFATLFVCISDSYLGQCSYASAGHEPALLFTDRHHAHISPTGPILGLELGDSSRYVARQFAAGRESTLVVVTDGITEARRESTGRLDFFGSTGVVRAFQTAREQGREPAAAIHDAALEHAARALTDDATVLVFRPES